MNNQIGLTDIPASSDSFEIGNYIDGLASFIMTCTTPMTVSIQGAWGTGKTSIMRMVKNRIDPDTDLEENSDEKSNYKCIYFNTWEFSQLNLSKNITLVMLNQLSRALADRDNAIKKVAGEIFDVVLKIGTGYLSGGREVDAKEAFSKDEIEQLKDLKKQFQLLINMKLGRVDDKYKLGKNTDEDKKVLSWIEPNNRRVIFFIDDLDRLNPEKAVEILEVLKNFLDCKNCVFVLAIDYDVVCRGVASKYKFNPDDPKSNKKGKDFFDKIIQVPFKMPVEQYNITAYMKQLLESVNVKNEKLMNDADNYEQYENLVKASIGTNPRAIKRLVNSYQLIAIVVGFNNEIDIHDKKMKLLLFATLCLQELDLNVYRLVAQNKNNLRAEHLLCFTDAATNPIDEVYEDIEIKDIDQDRVEVFMQLLIDILKKDNKTAIEDEDLLPFITILKFASITGNDAPSIEIKKGTAETRNSVDELKNVIDKDAFNKMSIIIQEEAGIKATLMDRPNDAKITAFIGGTNKIKVEFFEKKTGGFTLWCEARSAFFDEGNFPADIEAVLSNRNATRTKPIKKNFTSKNSLNKYFSFAVSLPDDEADIRAILRGCKESL